MPKPKQNGATAALPGTAASGAAALPDQAARDAVLTQLDTTMLVEAAAGTGKTTSMVGRMIALLRQGKCTVGELVAVTFTYKAAGELRARFQNQLEKAAREASGAERARLQAAVAHVDQCFVGTIHSFCARLLRERPVEAGVDPGFQELDEDTDLGLRQQAWDEFVARLHAEGDPLLEKLTDLGLEVTQLADAFACYAEHADVPEWPSAAEPLGDLRAAADAMTAFAAEIAETSRAFPPDRGDCKLMNACDSLLRRVRQADLDCPADLMDVLVLFRKPIKAKYKCWPGDKAQAKPLEERWNSFAETIAQPMLQRWYEHRYATVMLLLPAARKIYERLRHQAGGLNFQDLLVKTAALLRTQPSIRRALRRRFSRILVDEFQDTDPIQAEVLLLLTADDPNVEDWCKCRPVAGSLFVVGDPKQSIYRFRRADIVTYNQVKEIIANNGALVKLQANFRTVPRVIDWINGVFEAFPENATDYTPERTPLQPGRSVNENGDLCGVRLLLLPEEASKKTEQIAAYEPQLVARTIHAWLTTGKTIPLPAASRRTDPRVTPGDFLIITQRKKQLPLYARALDELGIPNQVSGGSSFQLVEELRLLRDCLRVLIEPDNPIALVAVLRGSLFGFSDPTLYAYKKAGGRFLLTRSLPADLLAADAEPFREAFERLHQCASWLRRLPPLAALERIVAELGLAARAAAGPGGNMRAGGLAKALEALRAVQPELHSPADLLAYLERILSEEMDIEGAPAREPEQAAVRLMNLHQAKGLEAPIVFLVDPTGEKPRSTTLHVDRREGKARGYLAIDGPQVSFAPPPRLAQPPGWSDCEEEEQRFRAAEKLRLLYVAATRAAALLVISQRRARNDKNPWEFFETALAGCEVLGDPEVVSSPSAPGVALSLADCEQARLRSAERWTAARTPSYRVMAAKAFAADGNPRSDTGGREFADEFGTDWGTVVHFLLETAIRRPQADLLRLAREALAEHDATLVTRADEAVALVERVRRSALWQRVTASTQRLVEVPFETLWPLSPPHDEPPLVLRGVIDLAFRERDGWVIVDYKTHSSPPKRIVEQYSGQVKLYAEIWRELTKAPVKEVGLYLTHTDEYVRIQ